MKNRTIFKSVIVVSTLLLASHLVGKDDITITKEKIVQKLQKNNPTALADCKKLFAHYDDAVNRFFDNNNNQSLAAHVQQFDKDILILKSSCRDPRFASVKPLLEELQSDVIELVKIFRSYIGARSSFLFAMAVRSYRYLLPDPLADWSNFKLFGCLRHRLGC